MGFKVGDRVQYVGRPGVYEGTGRVSEIKPGSDRFVILWDAEGDYTTETSDNLRSLDYTETTQTFAMNVNRITNKIANLLIDKNQSYGDSALNPARIFSKADRIEQLNVRIDDKLSRIQRGGEFAGDDTEIDLIGYLILRIIAKESA